MKLESKDSAVNVIDQAYQTQLKNIQVRTGKSLVEMYAFIREMAKHGLS